MCLKRQFLTHTSSLARIVLQVPIPFRAFKEPVNYVARRKRGQGMRFAWASETVAFRSRRDVLRFSTATSGCTGTCTRCWVGVERRDRVRSLCAAQFPPPLRDDG